MGSMRLRLCARRCVHLHRRCTVCCVPGFDGRAPREAMRGVCCVVCCACCTCHAGMLVATCTVRDPGARPTFQSLSDAVSGAGGGLPAHYNPATGKAKA